MKRFEDRIILACDSHHGQFIPQVFLEIWAEHLVFGEGVNGEQGVEVIDFDAILTGPDDEHYWEEWMKLLDNGRVLLDDKLYVIVQNEDLWLIEENESIPEDFWI